MLILHRSSNSLKGHSISEKKPETAHEDISENSIKQMTYINPQIDVSQWMRVIFKAASISIIDHRKINIRYKEITWLLVSKEVMNILSVWIWKVGKMLLTSPRNFKWGYFFLYISQIPSTIYINIINS